MIPWPEPLVARSVGELGPEWDAVFAAGADGQSTRAWFAASAEAALPPDAEPQFLGFPDVDGPAALFPMLDTQDGIFRSLTTPYTCLYQPLLRPGLPPASVQAAMAGFARHCRRWPVTRLEALDPAWSGLGALRAGFAQARLLAREFSHFVNWRAPIEAGSWERYLQSRPGALRETIRRKGRAAERQADLRFEIARTGPGLVRLLAAYEQVYARSWKEPEPFPAFNSTLVRTLADTGELRMFVLWRADQPIAAQYWTVVAGSATVLKLAHDEAFKALSPGTVLTAFAIRHLIDTERIFDLDFGRGDDPYKRAWTGERRVRIGLLGLDPLSTKGLGMLARHDLGRLRRLVRDRVCKARSISSSTAC